jgi:hypothetical protein
MVIGKAIFLLFTGKPLQPGNRLMRFHYASTGINRLGVWISWILQLKARLPSFHA